MDQNPAILSLFDKCGYTVMWAAPHTSHQNYPDEGPHSYIRETDRSILKGLQVPPKLWSYALIHYIIGHGMVPHVES